MVFTKMQNAIGVFAIADLDIEDGSIHTENTGVFHFGFERTLFQDKAIAAGFKNLKTITSCIDEKPHGKYPVFLLTVINNKYSKFKMILFVPGL